ncbi:MAG: hypothetical protein KDB51_14870, partial [Propionibacteriaceae bacterium]|nr:hypothetical protein [Propionibacteriaceae bacterium]
GRADCGWSSLSRPGAARVFDQLNQRPSLISGSLGGQDSSKNLFGEPWGDLSHPRPDRVCVRPTSDSG